MIENKVALGRKIAVVVDEFGDTVYYGGDGKVVWKPSQIDRRDLLSALYLHGSMDEEDNIKETA